MPAGGLLGDLALPRLLRRGSHGRAVAPLAVLTLLALTALAVEPSTTAALGLWLLVGLGSSVTVLAAPLVMAAVPADHRARAYGVATSLLMAVQGVAVLASAALAHHLSVAQALGVVGVAGLLALAVLGVLTRLPRGAVPVTVLPRPDPEVVAPAALLPVA